MIRNEDVAHLRAGDVVRITGWYGVTIEGPLQESMGTLWLGEHCRVTAPDGGPAAWMSRIVPTSLTVISRAKPPLYVNHDRTEPVAGDVVAAPDDDEPIPGWRPTWARSVDGVWLGTHTGRPIEGEMLDRLRLLVDGETGQVVP